MKQQIKKVIALFSVLFCLATFVVIAQSPKSSLDIFIGIVIIGLILLVKKIADGVVNAAFQIVEKDDK